MADRIKCTNCGAESYNEYRKTQLVCISCYRKAEDRIAALEKEVDEALTKAADKSAAADWYRGCCGDVLMVLKEIERDTAEQCAQIAETWRGRDGISCGHRLDIADAIRSRISELEGEEG